MERSILLLEDDDSLNRGVSLKLTRQGYQVYAATTIAQAKSLFTGHPVDLVICDIGLPDGSGLDFCRWVRRSHQTLFLFLTALDTELDIVEGYDVGADDYVTKPFSLSVLMAKVDALLRRLPDSDEDGPLRSGEIVLYPRQQRAEKNGQLLSLTANEWKLLQLFVRHPGHVLSRQQLLAAIWELDSDYVDENAVAVNIRRLREKVEDDPSLPRYIKNVRGLGYVWEGKKSGGS